MKHRLSLLFTLLSLSIASSGEKASGIRTDSLLEIRLNRIAKAESLHVSRMSPGARQRLFDSLHVSGPAEMKAWMLRRLRHRADSIRTVAAAKKRLKYPANPPGARFDPSTMAFRQRGVRSRYPDSTRKEMEIRHRLRMDSFRRKFKEARLKALVTCIKDTRQIDTLPELTDEDRASLRQKFEARRAAQK